MSIKILIMEDNEILNEMYSMKFRIEWFDVESSLDGKSGLEKLKTFTPDIILLDIMMPWMNGFEAFELIKKQCSYPVKVIIFTNLTSKDDNDRALALGATDCLIKADTTPKQAVERVRALFPNEG